MKSLQKSAEAEGERQPALTRVLLVSEYVLLAQGLAALLQDQSRTSVRITGLTSDLQAIVREWRPGIILVETADVGATAEFWGPLQASNSSIPLVIIAPADSEQLKSALLAGARGFVPREASADQLLNCLDAVSRGEWGLPRSFLGELVQEYLALRTAEHAPALQLSERELAILTGLAAGQSARQIGANVFLSESAVRTEIRILKQRVGARTRSHLVAEARRLGAFASLENGEAARTSGTDRRD